MTFTNEDRAAFRAAEATDIANGVIYSPPVTGLRVTPLGTVEAKRVPWLWQMWIVAATFNLLAGPEGVGKSTFLAWLSSLFTNGKLEGDYHGIPGVVLIAALEDDVAATLRPRMEAAGADLARVAYIDGPDGGGLRLPEHLPLLEQALRRFHPDAPKLVIVDPIKSTTTVKTRDESEVRPFLQELLDFSARTTATIFAATHFKKGARVEDFAAWKVSGDPAWTQVPRSVLFFDEDPQADEDDPDARVLAHAKCNVGRRQETLTARVVSTQIESRSGQIETSRMLFEGRSSVRADDLGKRDNEQAIARSDAEEFLSAYLSDGQEHEANLIKGAAIADGHSEATLGRAARKLGVKKRREGSGVNHRSLWSLPPTIDRNEQSDRGQDSGLTLVIPVTQITDPLLQREGESYEDWNLRNFGGVA